LKIKWEELDIFRVGRGTFGIVYLDPLTQLPMGLIVDSIGAMNTLPMSALVNPLPCTMEDIAADKDYILVFKAAYQVVRELFDAQPEDLAPERG